MTTSKSKTPRMLPRMAPRTAAEIPPWEAESGKGVAELEEMGVAELEEIDVAELDEVGVSERDGEELKKEVGIEDEI